MGEEDASTEQLGLAQQLGPFGQPIDQCQANVTAARHCWSATLERVFSPRFIGESIVAHCFSPSAER